MATILFSNNATSNLAGAISNVATTAQLTTGSGVLFPTPGANQYFKLTFIDAATGLLREIVGVTAISGDQITIVRAQEGTTARAWLAGDLAVNMWTAGSAAAMAQQANLFGAFCIDTGSANNIVITVPNNPSSLAALTGVPITVLKVNSGNTGEVFVTANGFAATPLFLPDKNTLVGGELFPQSINTIVFDGANWILQSGNPGVIAGGTGRTAGLTAHSLLVGAGTAPVTMLATGVAGQVLVSGGPAADPSFGSIGVPGGGTGQTSFPTHSVILGEGGNPLGSAVPNATVGTPLLSNGANSDPGFGQLNLAGGGVTGITSVANGGTGRSFCGQGVLLGENGNPIDSAPYGAAGTVLLSNGPTTDASFGQLNLAGLGVTGTLGVGNGGTGENGFGLYQVICGGGGSSPLIGVSPGVQGVPLLSDGNSGFPFFSALNLSNPSGQVTGVLPVANGGTGEGALTTGALLVGQGTNPVTGIFASSQHLGSAASFGPIIPCYYGVTSTANPNGVITGTGGDIVKTNNGDYYINNGGGVGTSWIRFLQDADFIFVGTSAGYIKFPNGFIIQWQNEAAPTQAVTTYNFPITFPNGAFFAIAQIGYLIAGGSGILTNPGTTPAVGAQPINTGQFNLAVAALDTGFDGVWIVSMGV